MTDTPPQPSRRLTHRLNAVFVRTAPPGFYCDGHGLNLRVDPSGARRWVQRLVIRGRPRMLGLGGYPLLSLDERALVRRPNSDWYLVLDVGCTRDLMPTIVSPRTSRLLTRRQHLLEEQYSRTNAVRQPLRRRDGD